MTAFKVPLEGNVPEVHIHLQDTAFSLLSYSGVCAWHLTQKRTAETARPSEPSLGDGNYISSIVRQGSDDMLELDGAAVSNFSQALSGPSASGMGSLLLPTLRLCLALSPLLALFIL
ncbi:hypothetical protein PHLCEN_2v7110 [Hermanssonia centrifuga]|uniref:Uncharacterized protein n=1 Tax=Hermanssonia centrifuga TaxID=98765 RepID=A0A2R6NXJ1_9APHY|nr:hypothetical protein PHLCEN_2v7110 [Hermanssonia centrifuga]